MSQICFQDEFLLFFQHVQLTAFTFNSLFFRLDQFLRLRTIWWMKIQICSNYIFRRNFIVRFQYLILIWQHNFNALARRRYFYFYKIFQKIIFPIQSWFYPYLVKWQPHQNTNWYFQKLGYHQSKNIYPYIWEPRLFFCSSFDLRC